MVQGLSLFFSGIIWSWVVAWISTLPDADQTVIWMDKSTSWKKNTGRKDGWYKTLMAKTIFLYGIKDGWLPPISFLFIYSFCYGNIVEAISCWWKDWEDGWMENIEKLVWKKHNFVISCYQLLSKVVISCYRVNSSKNWVVIKNSQSCYQLLSSCYHWHRYQLFWKNDSSENSVVEIFSMSHEFVLVLGLNQLTVPK